MMRWAHVIQAITGGFILAVLWFDLKFDLLAYPHMMYGVELAGQDLATIKSYYLQVLSMERAGFPLITIMMLACIIATLFESIRGRHISPWRRIAAPLLVIPPILLAGIRVVPTAGTLAQSTASHADQVTLSVAILQDHLFCFVSISCFLLLQVTRRQGYRQKE